MPVFRDDPYPNFNFLVQLGEIISDPGTVIAGFSEVSGLDIHTPVISYRNGNDRTLVKRNVGGLVSHSPIVMKRGVTGDDTLWKWVQQFADGEGTEQTMRITLLNEKREAVMEWVARGVRPVKISGPSLDACGSAVAIESVELVHEGLELGS
ncbi:MAG: phage tail protein [Gammaproteobacteria bacterium]|nr:phage tail protein [Gammaproteobacteria bacterium]